MMNIKNIPKPESKNLKEKNKNPLTIGNVKLESGVILAPMAGITDTVLRQLVREEAKGLLYTEMISSEALKFNRPSPVVDYEEKQYPLTFQISGHKPDLMAEAAKKLEERATIIDINMGCPVNKIIKNSDGAKLMTDLKLASEIIEKVKKSISIPLTVKCRLGWDCNSKNYLEFTKMAEDSGADAVIVHCRTRSQMYSGNADWSKIKEIKEQLTIPVIANGDITSPEKALECLNITGADGIAVGRGVLGDYKIISRIENYLYEDILLPSPDIPEKIEMARKHCLMEMKYRGEEYGINFMRKFFAWYVKGIRNGAKYRSMLVRVSSLDEIEKIFNEILEIKPKKRT